MTSAGGPNVVWIALRKHHLQKRMNERMNGMKARA